MTTALELSRLTTVQSKIVRGASSDLASVVAGLDLSSPVAARNNLLESFPAIVDTYGNASATASAKWYEQTRRIHVGGTFSAALAPEIPPERALETVRWAAGALWGDYPPSILALLDGSLTRALEDQSRQTVIESLRADNWAYGFHRIARADGCDFCVMLTGRGAVYRRDTADFAAHDNCHCKAAPSWDPDAPEVDVKLYEVSKRTAEIRAQINDPSLTPGIRAAAQRELDDRRASVRAYIDSDPDRIAAIRAELV